MRILKSTRLFFTFRMIIAALVFSLPYSILITIFSTLAKIVREREISIMDVLTAGNFTQVFDDATFIPNLISQTGNSYPSFIITGIAIYLLIEKYFRFSLLICIVAGIVIIATQILLFSGTFSSKSLDDSLMIIATILLVVSLIIGPITGVLFWLSFVLKNTHLADTSISDSESA